METLEFNSLLSSVTGQKFTTLEQVCKEVENEIREGYKCYSKTFGPTEWKYIQKSLFIHYKARTDITKTEIYEIVLYAYYRSIQELEEQTKLLDEWLYKHTDFSISKKQEINLLEKLCYTDSVFAKEFRQYFLRMKSNILNNKPILDNIKPTVPPIDNY